MLNRTSRWLSTLTPGASFVKQVISISMAASSPLGLVLGDDDVDEDGVDDTLEDGELDGLDDTLDDGELDGLADTLDDGDDDTLEDGDDDGWKTEMMMLTNWGWGTTTGWKMPTRWDWNLRYLRATTMQMTTATTTG